MVGGAGLGSAVRVPGEGAPETGVARSGPERGRAGPLDEDEIEDWSVSNS